MDTFHLFQSAYQWIVKPQTIIKSNEMFLPGRMSFIFDMVRVSISDIFLDLIIVFSHFQWSLTNLFQRLTHLPDLCYHYLILLCLCIQQHEHPPEQTSDYLPKTSHFWLGSCVTFTKASICLYKAGAMWHVLTRLSMLTINTLYVLIIDPVFCTHSLLQWSVVLLGTYALLEF